MSSQRFILRAAPEVNDVEEVVRFIEELFRRGFLIDSPDFIQEKQPDGRYQVKLRKNAFSK